MTESTRTSEEDVAIKIRAAVAALNTAIDEAVKLGIDVEIESKESVNIPALPHHPI